MCGLIALKDDTYCWLPWPPSTICDWLATQALRPKATKASLILVTPSLASRAIRHVIHRSHQVSTCVIIVVVARRPTVATAATEV